MEKPKIDSLSSSLAELSGSSRSIPADKDFHFYYNFNEFKLPIKGIADKSKSMLDAVGRYSGEIWGKEMVFPEDDDDAYDWLVNMNDEVFENFDFSGDEFRAMRKRDEENGFQLVYGKKKKGVSQLVKEKGAESLSLPDVKVASRDKKTMGTKPKVPFHIPTIPRPQDEYKILVNNSNQPFEHVWLQRSEDGSRFIHPLEKFSALDFIDKNVGDLEPAKPLPVECTPFKLVEEVKDLKEVAAKLRGVDEFAVDLEHNQYRSFQGLTCLMQISTRTDDFVIDTLKLRIHIGPYLREVFKDPTKKKVMHGADRDIIWLQRDFGIYICNLFDTGQASRILKLERNSLEYLLHHFCGVAANKEYQNADWRLRPLPDEMLRYAREDTHYLLHIYDLMRIRLLSSESEYPETSLQEVYQRSYDISMQIYEKEVLTDSSYIYLFGLQGAGLNAQQLAIVAGLYEWRDVVARAEDESTGYILPNKTLIEIAKQMPIFTSKLRPLVRSKHPYIERNLGSVVSIVRHSMQNSAAFEAAAEHLKERRAERTSDGNAIGTVNSEPLSPPDDLARLKAATRAESVGGSNIIDRNLLGHLPGSVELIGKCSELENGNVEVGRNQNEGSSQHLGDILNAKNVKDCYIPALAGESFSLSDYVKEASGAEATVQVSKNPSRAFGAFLGKPAAKRKFDSGKIENNEIKLEQIKSSVNLPFQSFLVRDNQLQQVVKEPVKSIENSHQNEHITVQATTSSHSEDIILLEADPNADEPVEDHPNPSDDKPELKEENTLESYVEMDNGNEIKSLSELSSSFKKCFQSTNQTRKSKQVEKLQECKGLLQFKPFDYAAARKQVTFGEVRGGKIGEEGDQNHEGRKSKRETANRKKSSSGLSDPQGRASEESGGFQLGRRRQAFPATGNRSATFR